MDAHKSGSLQLFSAVKDFEGQKFCCIVNKMQPESFWREINPPQKSALLCRSFRSHPACNGLSAVNLMNWVTNQLQSKTPWNAACCFGGHLSHAKMQTLEVAPLKGWIHSGCLPPNCYSKPKLATWLKILCSVDSFPVEFLVAIARLCCASWCHDLAPVRFHIPSHTLKTSLPLLEAKRSNLIKVLCQPMVQGAQYVAMLDIVGVSLWNPNEQTCRKLWWNLWWNCFSLFT